MPIPFFWFLINKTTVLEKVEEFVSVADKNTGLVIHYNDLEKIKPEIVEFVRLNYNIPSAVYFSKDNKLKPSSINNFSTTICLYNKQEKISIKPGFVSFKISDHDEKISKICWLLNQLADYFIFKSRFPKKEAVAVITNFKTKLYNPEFFSLMQNLGIYNFMVPFSSKNISYLKKTNDKFNNLSGNRKPELIPLFDKWRRQIDILDNTLIDILKQRLQIVHEMGKAKQQNNQPFFDAERWYKILLSRKKIAKESGLDEKLIEEIFSVIHLYNLRFMLSQTE